MNLPIYILALLPFFVFLLALVPSAKDEKKIVTIAIGGVLLELIILIFYIFNWFKTGMTAVYQRQWLLFDAPEFEFFISFHMDGKGLIFLFMGLIIGLIVLRFSQFYMHRDEGFKRFFIQVLLFLFGYTIVSLSGNLETLFIGWEIVGITSFLLISFYRSRFLPVKNAMKVISLYRLGDLFLILAMWLIHHLWKGNISFEDWENQLAIGKLYQEYPWGLTLVMFFIFVAVSVKSGLLPFSSWVPRAMEGPSSSSALFYGALSLHLGIFLLIRAEPIWIQMPGFRVFMSTMGIITALVTNSIARYQPTVKTQIAYASIAQIGLIVVELSLGFTYLAIFHMIGNSFLRSFQLLVSPSVLGYKVHGQLFNPAPSRVGTSSKWRNTLYMLSIMEFNLDRWQYTNLMLPFKSLGVFLFKFRFHVIKIVFTIVLIGGVFIYIYEDMIELSGWLPPAFAALALALVLSAFANRKSAIQVLLKVMFAHFCLIAAVNSSGELPIRHSVYYLLFVLFFTFTGLITLYKIKKIQSREDLADYKGYIYHHKNEAFFYLISVLGLVGFPVSPLFIGVDYMLVFIKHHQFLTIVLFGFSLLFLEIALIRSYVRIFCGPVENAIHPQAFRSS